MTSGSKPNSVKKARSVHTPSDYYRPSSAETSGKLRGITPRSIHPSLETVTREPEEWLPVSTDVIPGGRDWKFCSQPVPETLAKGLVHKWPAIEQTFVKTLKQVFQMMRGEREAICQYFFARRWVCLWRHKWDF